MKERIHHSSIGIFIVCMFYLGELNHAHAHVYILRIGIQYLKEWTKEGKLEEEEK